MRVTEWIDKVEYDTSKTMTREILLKHINSLSPESIGLLNNIMEEISDLVPPLAFKCVGGWGAPGIHIKLIEAIDGYDVLGAVIPMKRGNVQIRCRIKILGFEHTNDGQLDWLKKTSSVEDASNLRTYLLTHT